MSKLRLNWKLIKEVVKSCLSFIWPKYRFKGLCSKLVIQNSNYYSLMRFKHFKEMYWVLAIISTRFLQDARYPNCRIFRIYQWTYGLKESYLLPSVMQKLKITDIQSKIHLAMTLQIKIQVYNNLANTSNSKKPLLLSIHWGVASPRLN